MLNVKSGGMVSANVTGFTECESECIHQCKERLGSPRRGKNDSEGNSESLENDHLAIVTSRLTLAQRPPPKK